jgi:hypothetical protein
VEAGANAPSKSRLQATFGGCENDRLRVNHTICMPAKIGLKRDCLRLLFQRRCGAQLQQRSGGAIPSNLPPSLVRSFVGQIVAELVTAFSQPVGSSQ